MEELIEETFPEKLEEIITDTIVDEIEIKTDKAPKPLNAIQLSTYFSAKGREFDYVFMPTLTDRKWEKGKANKAGIPLSPDEYKSEDELKEEKISDRIKVMYVGMTRARHSLFLSYPIDKTPSDFISKIQENLKITEAKDLTIEEFWQKHTGIIEMPGILNCLAVESWQTYGQEIFEILDGEHPNIKEAFIESLKWRNDRQISKKAQKYVNDSILWDGSVVCKFVETLILVGTRRDFAFNADKLVDFICGMPMPDRDAFLIPIFNFI